MSYRITRQMYEIFARVPHDIRSFLIADRDVSFRVQDCGDAGLPGLPFTANTGSASWRWMTYGFARQGAGACPWKYCSTGIRNFLIGIAMLTCFFRLNGGDSN
jgi:hypothetical protein